MKSYTTLKKNNVTFKALLERFFFEINHREETRKGYIKVVNQLLKFDKDTTPDMPSRDDLLCWRCQKLYVIKSIT